MMLNFTIIIIFIIKFYYYLKIVEIFETRANCLSKEDFIHFILPHINDIIAMVKMESQCPIILFPKGVNHSLQEIANSGADVIAIDWNICPSLARTLTNNKVVLMVNFLLFLSYLIKKLLKYNILYFLHNYIIFLYFVII